MMFGPLHHSSPAALTPSLGTSISLPVSGSTILHSMFGIVRPTVSRGISSRSTGIACETGLISLMPYPCRTMQFRRDATACPSSPSRGAAPEKTTLTLDRSKLSTMGCFASATAIGGAMNTQVTFWSWMIRKNSGRSKRGMVTSEERARRARFSSTVMP